MFEPEVFWKQMYVVLNKVLSTLLGLFGAPRSDSASHSDSAPGELYPLALLVTPHVCIHLFYRIQHLPHMFLAAHNFWLCVTYTFYTFKPF